MRHVDRYRDDYLRQTQALFCLFAQAPETCSEAWSFAGTVSTVTLPQYQPDTGYAIDRRLGVARGALIGTLIVVIPFNWLGLIVIDEHGPHLASLSLAETTLGAIDLVLGLLIVSAIATMVRTSKRLSLSLGLGGMVALSTVGMLSLLFTPSLAGAAAVFRLLGVVAVIVNMRALDRDRYINFVVTPFAVVAIFQSTLALTQTFILHCGPGAAAKSAPGVILWTTGIGSFFHQYPLAAFLALSMAVILSVQRFRNLNPLELSAVALSSAAMATTFSRTAALSVMLLGIVYAVVWFRRRRRELAISALIVSIPAIVTGLVLHSMWLGRAAESLALQTSGRGKFMARAFEIIGDNILVGVGPAQYGPTLVSMGLTGSDTLMVHSVPLMITVEYGVVIGVLAVIWSIAMGVRATRSSVYALGVFLAVVPFLLLDNLHYVFPSGIASVGLWVAVLDFNSANEHESAEDGRVRGSRRST